MSDESGIASGAADAEARAPSGTNKQLLIVLGALALTALLYWPTSIEIADVWQDTVRRRYTHGWAVLAVTVWLIWRDREHLATIPLAPPRGGWLLVALGSVVWLIGFNAGLLAVSTLVMPLLVLTTIWAAGGWQLARRVAFPVLFLYFALPVWELISPALQSMTAIVSVWLTSLVGIPVLMEDNVIHIPEGWFEVAGGCNGLHFFIVALAIAAVHGHLDRDDLRSRCLLLGIAGTMALVTNWLRVFVVIVAGHLTDMQHFLVRVDHYYFGWVLFAFTLILYVYVASRVPRRRRAEPPPQPLPSTSRDYRALAPALLSLVALAAGPAWSFVEMTGAELSRQQRPPSLTGWSGPDVHQSDWRPVFANADEELLVTYRNEVVGAVMLYQVLYRSQRQGKELRGQGNSVAGEGYRVIQSRERDVSSGKAVIPVIEQRVEARDGREMLVWSTFIVDGRPDPMRLRSQIAYGARSLIRAPTAGVIAVGAECRPDCDHARQALEGFSAQALPAMLPSIKGSGSPLGMAPGAN